MFRRAVKYDQPRRPTTAHTLDRCPVRSFTLLTADANNNKILHVDEDTALLFGKSVEELIGCDVRSVIRTNKQASKTLSKEEDNDDQTDFFFVGTHKSGATIYLHACIHLAIEPETQVEKHLYLLCDITKLHSLFSLSSKQQQKRNKPTETFVANLTPWGVVNSVYPPVFLGRTAGEIMNTSMMKYVHPNDVKMLVTSLKECCGKSFGSATVRWWVGQGEVDKKEYGEGVVEEDLSIEDEEEEEDDDDYDDYDDYDDDDEEEEEEECWCPDNYETEEQDKEDYILVQITTLLSPPTAASPDGEPVCILRALESDTQKPDTSKPTTREIARLTIEAAIAVAAVSPFSPRPSSTVTLPNIDPSSAVGKALSYPAYLIARLWDELARAIQLGRNYILDHAQHLFDLILSTISFIANIDIPAAIAGSAHPSLPAPIRALVTHAARTDLVRNIFGTIGRSRIGGVIGLDNMESEDACINVAVGLAEGGWARFGERSRVRE